MKNINYFNKNELCDSCIHILEEQGSCFLDEEYNIFSLAEECQRGNGDKCVSCGQKIDKVNKVTDAEKDLQLLESALNNKNIKVICFTAPSIRVSLGDDFGFAPGENVETKMVGALKTLGFDAVFDMNTAADFTILEEAEELKKRLAANKNLPMFTSCCPGWVNYCTKVCKEFVPNLSTCKSPQQMFGAILNNYYAEKFGVKSTEMFIVSIVPCVIKKLELKQEEINTNIGFDVDVAITTREIAKLLKNRKIDLKEVKDSSFDNFFGSSSGAGAIFGNTGGVTEAVLRTINDSLSKEEQKELEYKVVRGLEGVRRADVKLGDRVLKLAVVMGLKNVNIVIEELRKEPNKYDFIEVMACEGGCVGGAGQPIVDKLPLSELLKARNVGLYQSELKKQHRKAHKNPAIIEVYNNYLGEIGGEKAKKFLHRKY